MKVVVDFDNTNKVNTDLVDNAIVVNSLNVNILPYDKEDDIQRRAEYLYKVCVDNDTHMCIVTDSELQKKLIELGIQTLLSLS